MAFLDKSAFAPSQGSAQGVTGRKHPALADGDIPANVKSAYMNGCVLAGLLEHDALSGKARSAIDALGDALGLSREEVQECVDGVKSVGPGDKSEFVEDFVKELTGKPLCHWFLYDFEKVASEDGGMSADGYLFLDAIGRRISGAGAEWRLRVLEQARDMGIESAWIDFCRKAANADDAGAMLVLGKCLRSGRGVKADRAKSLKWYQKAAEAGISSAAAEARTIEDEIAREKEQRRKQREAEEQARREREEAEALARQKRLEEEERARQKAAAEMGEKVGKFLSCVISIGIIYLVYSLLRGCVSSGREEAAQNIIANMVSIPGTDYRMGRTEVTQAQWDAFMWRNPSKFSGDDRPVERVSWEDCQDFIEKLNDCDAVEEAGIVFRLPTEKEWEYACRAGSSSDWGLVEDGQPGSPRELGWIDCGETKPVASKKPNAFGLYDMHGNVFEWCSDSKPGLFGGVNRVNKGGAYDKSADKCTASYSDSDAEGSYYSNLGFRLLNTKR